MAMFHSIWTVLMFITFIGIIAWAFSSKRKDAFDKAARTPLDDDDDVVPSKENNHV